ncbi:MAG: hypothetical protein R3350_10065, partial [Saprospiraceae bacterium]|nr:hypothetical protein [Saprospiraceae bacterium]
MKRERYTEIIRLTGLWRWLALVPALAFSLSAFGQKIDAAPYQPLFSLPVSASYFTVDRLGNIYLVTATNEVIKYDKSGRESFRYSNNTLGQLSMIDATDPFNLLLYYPDLQVAITLDRTLNPTGSFNLYQWDLVGVEAMATAVDNHLWIYDQLNFRLLKVDAQGQVLVESNDLSLVFSTLPRPSSMRARGNRVYLNDPAQGILVFDVFGQYLQTLPLKGITDFWFVKEQIAYQHKGHLYSYDLRSFHRVTTERPWQTPPQGSGALRYFDCLAFEDKAF